MMEDENEENSLENTSMFGWDEVCHQFYARKKCQQIMYSI